MISLFYIRGQSNIGRTVCVDELHWTDDAWPYFINGSPSTTEQQGPEI